ncbi:MAG TPA: TetR/AcrR family transcriptional regulator [Bacilli bacterium]|nr:MAG: regulatory protein [Tenericutes bacterium ADurb.BinA124]HNZ50154.1 TetR/AcrR family transcriptional regulator [Bacilli bacterium]HOH17968.1 TetR/AcrR family transcriptional regulator [Bacilli bacterium]HPN61105.1 TetR/AcrR family transcriptional regulator [Bacilli bacterium]HPX84791.1 TetR/AcrR family transcriptional regulator [Bacilli bacterium]
MGIMTFKNLKKDKRERILEVALANFSTQAWEKITISQIVGQSQIPRGSFYQYFDTIHDLFAILLVYLFRKEQEPFGKWLGESNGDLKQALQLRFIRIMKHLEVYEQGWFLKNLLYFKSVNGELSLPAPINPQFDDETKAVINRVLRRESSDLLSYLEKLFTSCFLSYLEDSTSKEMLIRYFNQSLDLLFAKEEHTRRKNEVIIKDI